MPLGAFISHLILMFTEFTECLRQSDFKSQFSLDLQKINGLFFYNESHESHK